MSGIIYGEPAEIYHGNDAVSSSKLADMRIAGKLCPRNYYLRHVAKTVPRKDGAHFNIGTASHLLILEGRDAFADWVTTEPTTYKNDKGEVKPWSNNAKVCQAWHAEQANMGQIVLSQDEIDLIETMNAAILANPEAKRLCQTGKPEVTFRKEIAGLVLQCRADRWITEDDKATIVDLKSAATIERFEKDFYFLRYNFRAEFYRLVVREVLASMAGVPASEIPAPDFRFVVVEKTAPFRVKVYEPDEESLAAATREVHADLLTLKNCFATNVWPDGTEGIHSIGLSTWQLAKSYDESNAALSE